MLEKISSLLRPDVSTDARLTGISLFIGKCLEKLDSRIAPLEARQLQKGDKGDKGDTGERGKDGLDGKDGKNGTDGRNGLDGKDGKDGKSGTKGKDGVSVVDAEIAADDHLVLKLSNGNIIDAGEISASAANYQQIVNTQVSTVSNEDAAELTGGGVTTLHSHPAQVTSGITTIDFGTGKTDATVTVSSASITSGKVAKAYIVPQSTATNTADNHWVEDLTVMAGNVSAGVGFTIYAKCNTGFAHGTYNIGWEYL